MYGILWIFQFLPCLKQTLSYCISIVVAIYITKTELKTLKCQI